MRTTKRGKSDQSLTESQIQQLDSIGMQWEKRGDTAWATSYAQAKAYYEAHGNLRIPADYKTSDGIWLGNWLCRQRRMLKTDADDSKLTPDQREKLLELGIA